MFTEHTISSADVKATVSPDRGALVTGLRICEKDVLFMDRTTFDDATKNVRGGIPILFPFAGRLTNDQFVPARTKIGQHGFARNRSWTVFGSSSAEIRCALKSDAETMAVFPYEFELEQTYLILESGLRIELRISNLGAQAMPVAPGWHPYFVCPADHKKKIETGIRGFQTGKFINDAEFDFGITAPGGSARFILPELGTLQLSFSSNMQFLQFWSLPQKSFVCIEPFAGPPNVINTAQAPIVAPGTSETYSMQIQLAE